MRSPAEDELCSLLRALRTEPPHPTRFRAQLRERLERRQEPSSVRGVWRREGPWRLRLLMAAAMILGAGAAYGVSSRALAGPVLLPNVEPERLEVMARRAGPTWAGPPTRAPSVVPERRTERLTEAPTDALAEVRVRELREPAAVELPHVPLRDPVADVQGPRDVVIPEVRPADIAVPLREPGSLRAPMARRPTVELPGARAESPIGTTRPALRRELPVVPERERFRSSAPPMSERPGPSPPVRHGPTRGQR
jgi:hypothetical protein